MGLIGSGQTSRSNSTLNAIGLYNVTSTLPSMIDNRGRTSPAHATTTTTTTTTPPPSKSGAIGTTQVVGIAVASTTMLFVIVLVTLRFKKPRQSRRADCALFVPARYLEYPTRWEQCSACCRGHGEVCCRIVCWACLCQCFTTDNSSSSCRQAHEDFVHEPHIPLPPVRGREWIRALVATVDPNRRNRIEAVNRRRARVRADDADEEAAHALNDEGARVEVANGGDGDVGVSSV